MQDKVGLALGTNRIGVNYFYINNIEKSIEFHKMNLQVFLKIIFNSYQISIILLQHIII